MDFGAKKRDLGKHKSKAFFFFFCSVKTDLLKDGAISRLYIAFASKRDTGNYTCSMRNAQASVFVHILDGMYYLLFTHIKNAILPYFVFASLISKYYCAAIFLKVK